MNQLFALPTALCLPFPDIEALIQGLTIAAMPKMFIRSGQIFALYPANWCSSALHLASFLGHEVRSGKIRLPRAVYFAVDCVIISIYTNS